MFNLEDDDTLTIELLNKIIETDEQYKDNEDDYLTEIQFPIKKK